MTPTTRYLDPTNDVGFKKVFSEKNRMKDFLNNMLRLPEGKRIETLDFIPTEEMPDLGQGKRSLFDLKCKDQSGTQFLVEMQCRRTPLLMKRIQYYAAHAYTAQIQKGKKHKELLPVVVLTVMKEELFPSPIEIISYHKVREEKSHKCFLEALSYVFVELSKFNKTEEQLESFEDEWLYFLKTAEEASAPPHTLTDGLVKEAYSVMEKANWTPESYDAYIRACLLLEEEEFEIEEQFKAGKKEGLEEGLEQGLEQGRQERQAEIDKAQEETNKAQEEKRRLIQGIIKEGIDVELILKMTGLKMEELEDLKKVTNS